MKKLTKGILAAGLLGTGALGTGIALNANASEHSEYDRATEAYEYGGYFEDTFAVTDENFTDVHVINGLIATDIEDGGTWEITDQDGNVIESGIIEGDHAAISVRQHSVIDEDGNETFSTSPVEIHTFDTAEEFEAWLAESGGTTEFGVSFDEIEFDFQRERIGELH